MCVCDMGTLVGVGAVSVLADLCNVTEAYPGEITTIARQGSGSSCRSLYGGFVKWEMGSAEDGSDSKAVQVAPQEHWPEMEALIFVVSDKKKETGSTLGMSNSVKTSSLLAVRMRGLSSRAILTFSMWLQHRAAEVVAPRLAAIEKAWLEKDFESFARITMQDSNQFHACCMDTLPPIFYMNDVSKRIIGFVHKVNETAGRTLVRVGCCWCHAGTVFPHVLATLTFPYTDRLGTRLTPDPTLCFTCSVTTCHWCLR